jgi:hypothetical protein
MTLRNVFGMLLALLVGAVGYHLLFVRTRGAEESPLLVMVAQMRTRALIEHEREITVWYKTCPEVPGINPEVLVIWPGKLSYELDLTATEVRLNGDVLEVRAPAIRADEPSVPSETGQYIAQSSIWTLASDQELVLQEMQKASPLARHLSGYFLRHDPSLPTYFKEELEQFLRSIATALRVPIRQIDITIPEATAPVPARPPLTLCAGSSALANGVPFARLQADGTTIGIYPAKRPKTSEGAAGSTAPAEPRTN